MIKKTVKRKSSTKNSKALMENSNIIQYVLPLGNGWVVKSSNAIKFTVITNSWREAVSIARQMAKFKKTELVVYGRDFTIKEKRNYAINK